MAAQTEPLGTPRIGPEGARALARALPASRLAYLGLNFHKIEDEGAMAVFGALAQAPRMRKIGLRANDIGEGGGSALANALSVLRPEGVATVGLSGNLLTNVALHRIGEAIGQRFRIYHTITEVMMGPFFLCPLHVCFQYSTGLIPKARSHLCFAFMWV